MSYRMRKKAVSKLYCNLFYFAFAFSIFSSSNHESLASETTSKFSLSHVNYDSFTNLNFDLSDYINNNYYSTITLSENNYSGMALSNELEDEIKRLSDDYGIPYQIVLTIGEQESGGTWNTNGVISSTNDYGLFQINGANLSYINTKLGFTKDEILNDPIKNTEACLFLLNDITSRDDVDTLDDIFGMYNGWINWQKKKMSVDYVQNCSKIMNEYFPDYQLTQKISY